MTVLRTLLAAVAFLGGFSVNGRSFAELGGPLRKISNVDESDVPVRSRRQLSCTFPSDYPQSCFDSLDQIPSILSSGLGTVAAVDFGLNLRATLDGVCRSECLDPAVEFYTCLGENELVQAYESAFCGQDQGQYCFEVYRRGVSDSIVPTFTTSCTVYNASLSYLGCCAGSLFANPAVSNSFFPFNTLDFINCFANIDLALPEGCLPPTPETLQVTLMATTTGVSAIRVNSKWILLIASIAVAFLSSMY